MKRQKNLCQCSVKRRETRRENACGISGRPVTVKGEIAEMDLIACSRHRRGRALKRYSIIAKESK